MPNAFYNSTGNPGTNSPGLSATIRAEFAAIAAGFDKFPSTLIANRPMVVNSGGTALTLAGGGLILAGDLTTSGAFNTTLVQQATVTLTLPAVSSNVLGSANGRVDIVASGGNGVFFRDSQGSEPTNIAFGWLTDGAGTITNVELHAPLRYGGVTLSESVTGTGKMVLDTAPTLSNPVVGTQAFGDKSTKAASTDYVDTAIPAGAVLPFAGSSAPTGYLLCDGSAVSRTTYADLFAIIGTIYGAGDGSTTFNLPDLTGRVVAGKEAVATRITVAGSGFSGATLGAAGGSELHAHSVSGTININSGGPFGDNINVTIGGGGGSVGQGHQHNVNGPFGGTAAAVSRVQSTIILNYIIKT